SATGACVCHFVAATPGISAMRSLATSRMRVTAASSVRNRCCAPATAGSAVSSAAITITRRSMWALSASPWHRAAILQRHLREPAQVVEPAREIAALGEGLALVAKQLGRHRRGIQHLQRLGAYCLEERRVLHALQRSNASSLRSCSKAGPQAGNPRDELMMQRLILGRGHI